MVLGSMLISWKKEAVRYLQGSPIQKIKLSCHTNSIIGGGEGGEGTRRKTTIPDRPLAVLGMCGRLGGGTQSYSSPQIPDPGIGLPAPGGGGSSPSGTTEPPIRMALLQRRIPRTVR